MKKVGHSATYHILQVLRILIVSLLLQIVLQEIVKKVFGISIMMAEERKNVS